VAFPSDSDGTGGEFHVWVVVGFQAGDWDFFAGKSSAELDAVDCGGLNDEDLFVVVVYSFPVVLGIRRRGSVADRLVITLVGSPF